MRQFIIQKNKYKEKENQPDYRVVGKDGEEFIEIGAAWKKEDKNGSAYLSVKLKEPYDDKPGYKILSEAAQAPQNDANAQTGVAPQEDEVPDDISF